MFYFILEMIFFLALAMVALLMLRRLPLVDGFEEEKPSRGTGAFWGGVRWHWVDAMDKKVLFYSTKTLRRLKIWTMKFDALIARSLERVSPQINSGEGDAPHVIKTLQEDRQRAQEADDGKHRRSDE
ncbi:MAG: hypothetical protein WC246_01690 [Candidatus Paceibacterota bacterium]|jgi:hypothetical protein